jgi:hypothetical protein
VGVPDPVLLASRTWRVNTVCAWEFIVATDSNAAAVSKSRLILRTMISPWVDLI